MIWFLLGNRFQLCLSVHCRRLRKLSPTQYVLWSAGQNTEVPGPEKVSTIYLPRNLRLLLVLTKNSSKRCKYQFNVELWFLFVCLEFWSYSRIFHSFLDFGIMILYPCLFDLRNTLYLFTVVRKRTAVPNFEVTGLSIMYAINIPQKVLFLLM